MSEVKFDCQGLGLVARNEASILVFDTKPVLYLPVLDQIQFCSFDRGCKTCLDTKQVLDRGRFCSLTNVHLIPGGHNPFPPVTYVRDLCIQMSRSMLPCESTIGTYAEFTETILRYYGKLYLQTGQYNHWQRNCLRDKLNSTHFLNLV